MSVLDLFRNKQHEEEVEESDEINNSDVEKEDDKLNGLIVAEPNEDKITTTDLKDGNIENTCLFSHFNPDEVQGWKTFVAKEEYNNSWPTIREHVTKGVKSYQRNSKNKKF